MRTIVENFVKREKHEKLLIANTMFLVDYAARELREERNSTNRIPFNILKADESGNIPIVFDKLTRNLYKGYMPGDGLPPMTEQIILNTETFVPPAQRHLLDKGTAPQFATKQDATNRGLQPSAVKAEQPKQNARRRKQRSF